VDLTYGRYFPLALSSICAAKKRFDDSSLDIFGGSLVKFDELIHKALNK
jgi:hypothetical protein